VSDRLRAEREGERRADEERQQQERDRRSEELREAWRRNHPIREEDTDMNRTGRGTEDAGGAT
jgi:hypothetical protein